MNITKVCDGSHMCRAGVLRITYTRACEIGLQRDTVHLMSSVIAFVSVNLFPLSIPPGDGKNDGWRALSGLTCPHRAEKIVARMTGRQPVERTSGSKRSGSIREIRMIVGRYAILYSGWIRTLYIVTVGRSLRGTRLGRHD